MLPRRRQRLRARSRRPRTARAGPRRAASSPSRAPSSPIVTRPVTPSTVRPPRRPGPARPRSDPPRPPGRRAVRASIRAYGLVRQVLCRRRSAIRSAHEGSTEPARPRARPARHVVRREVAERQPRRRVGGREAAARPSDHCIGVRQTSRFGESGMRRGVRPGSSAASGSIGTLGRAISSPSRGDRVPRSVSSSISATRARRSSCPPSASGAGRRRRWSRVDRARTGAAASPRRPRRSCGASPPRAPRARTGS